MYYFAYGANLNKKVMKERCPQCKPLFRATLPNYSLIFLGYSRQWQGAVASLRRVPGSKVPGAVYELADIDLPKLDKIEGYPGEYNHIKVIVFDEDGTPSETLTYVKTGQGQEGKPSAAYLAVMHQGYKDWEIM